MTLWVRQVLRYLERRAKDGDRGARSLLRSAPRPAPKKKPLPSLGIVAARKRQAEREEREAIRKMRQEVWGRNLGFVLAGPHGFCDACFLVFRHPDEGELDHWIERSQGGEHTADNGWRLCPTCHRQKTDNKPSREFWDVLRARYCVDVGIPFVPRARERA